MAFEVKVTRTGGESCLKFNTPGEANQKTHADAMDLCKGLGGRLYEPESQEQFDLMFGAWEDQRNKKSDAWLGVSLSNGGSQDNNDDWKYSTRPEEKVAFKPRWKGNSASGGNSCAYFQGNNGKWLNDLNCESIANDFVCEF